MRLSGIEAETADTSVEAADTVEGCEDQVHDSTLPPTSTNSLTQSSLEDSLKVLSDPILVDSNSHDIVSITKSTPGPSQYNLPSDLTVVNQQLDMSLILNPKLNI